jgi:MFS family permease
VSDKLHRTRTLWLCTLLHAFTHIYQVALIPLYLLIRRDLHLASDERATFLVAAMGLTYFIPAYSMGILADRFNRKKLLAFGLTINALGFISLAFSRSYPAALFSVGLAGLGGSFYHPTATAMLVRLFPEAKGKALGQSAIGASLGFFVAPIYAGWRAQTAGWRQPVLELGSLGLLAALLFTWLAHDHPQPARDRTPGASNEKLFATPTLWMLFIGAALLFSLRDFAGSGMVSLGSLFLQTAKGFTPAQTGMALSCIYLASTVSNPILGSLSDRGRTGWAATMLGASAATAAVFPRLATQWFPVALSVYGFFFMASYPMVEAAVMEASDDSVRGRVFGLFITAGGLVGSLSHWCAGFWVQALGAGAAETRRYFGLYELLAICVATSLAGLACLRGLHRRKPAPSATVAAIAPIGI